MLSDDGGKGMNTAAHRTRTGTDPRLEEETIELHEALTELIRVYQFRDRDRICCFDVSVTQCHALRIVVNQAGLTMNDLAAALYLDKSTTSRVVDALERKGYVDRREHPDDKRALLLRATAPGTALLRRIEGRILAEEEEMLVEFDSDVRRSMAQLMRRLARAAASRSGLRENACAIPE